MSQDTIVHRQGPTPSQEIRSLIRDHCHGVSGMLPAMAATAFTKAFISLDPAQRRQAVAICNTYLKKAIDICDDDMHQAVEFIRALFISLQYVKQSHV